MQSDSGATDDRMAGVKSLVDEGIRRMRRLEDVGEFEAAIQEAQALIASIKSDVQGNGPALVAMVTKEIAGLERKIRDRNTALRSQKKYFVVNIVLPFCVALPGILMNIAALIIKPAMWQSAVMVARGGFYKGVPAHNTIILLLVFMVVYSLSFLDMAGDFLGGWASMRGSSTPSEGEKKIAVWFLRILLLAILYFSALANLRP
ncbi:MAG: hypothetical protein AB9903_09680 [Vulcanimicrobiota bacterium]